MLYYLGSARPAPWMASCGQITARRTLSLRKMTDR